MIIAVMGYFQPLVSLRLLPLLKVIPLIITLIDIWSGRKTDTYMVHGTGAFTHTYILSEPIKMDCLKGCRQNYVEKSPALTTLSCCSPVSHPCIMKRKTERI